MNRPKAVVYLRVSTEQQGISGLGIEAQRSAVKTFLDATKWHSVSEFVEIESGRRCDRAQLRKAIAECRIHGATLVVSRLDRLARSASFLLGLRDAQIEFVACDNPNANRLTIGILACVAEEEARLISERTRAALQAAKARGVKLGRPNLTDSARMIGTVRSAELRSARATRRTADLQPLLTELQLAGTTTLRGLAEALNARHVPAPRGGQWGAPQVRRLLPSVASNHHRTRKESAGGVS